MPSIAPRNWFPDGTSGRTDIAVAGLALVVVAQNAVIGTALAWSWAVVGFVTFAVAMGPVASSGFGSRVGTWFREIGVAGRVLVIVAFAVAAWFARTTVEAVATPLSSVGTGGLFAVVVFVAARTLYTRIEE
ncbi:hypothetical protein [Halorientalis halophila]|uniref:hypothetical protein n=1 Tax=Halorientalis halophila TaxID=3108499 RepID=UPI00300AB7B1